MSNIYKIPAGDMSDWRGYDLPVITVHNWCEENCKSYSHHFDDNGIVFVFTDEHDLLLFTMKFR